MKLTEPQHKRLMFEIFLSHNGYQEMFSLDKEMTLKLKDLNYEYKLEKEDASDLINILTNWNHETMEGRKNVTPELVASTNKQLKYFIDLYSKPNQA
jgi:hypothetical protein